MSQRVHAITINYHGAQNTAGCLASLNTSVAPIDLLVVDNTPNDPELVEVLKSHPTVKLLLSKDNVGFGRGNNMGIHWALTHTNCEVIFLLNNDAFIEPNTIANLKKSMDEHPDAAIVVPRIVHAEDPTKLWYGGGEVDWRRGSARVPGVPGSSESKIAMLPRYVTFASGCAMMIRSEVLMQEGGFDPRFFMYEEDLELSLRFQERGWRIWYEPKAVVRHIGQGSQKNRNGFVGRFHHRNPNLAFLVFHCVKNQLLNMSMHARGKNRLIFLGGYPIFIALKTLQWALHNRIDAIRSLVMALIAYRRERDNKQAPAVSGSEPI